MKQPLAIAAALAAAASLAVPALAGTKNVKIGDNYFVRSGSAPTVSVSRGTTVKWTWTGRVVHNVTVRKGPQKFHSATQQRGTFAHKMTRTGTYLIVCTIHPGMEMHLKVR